MQAETAETLVGLLRPETPGRVAHGPAFLGSLGPASSQALPPESREEREKKKIVTEEDEERTVVSSIYLVPSLGEIGREG